MQASRKNKKHWWQRKSERWVLIGAQAYNYTRMGGWTGEQVLAKEVRTKVVYRNLDTGKVKTEDIGGSWTLDQLKSGKEP